MFYCSLLRFMKVGALQIGHKGFIFKEFLRQSWQNVWPQFMLTGSNKIQTIENMKNKQTLTMNVKS